MQKKLGINITPTSVSWALVQNDDNEQKGILKSGIRTFKDAVEHTTKKEESTATIRTQKRSLRKLHRRKRNRKTDLLLELTKEGLCPSIPESEIKYWKQKKAFPNNEALREWLNVNAETGKNPYSDRHECLHRRLDLSLLEDRYILGRALYHLAQRRGYLDNKNETDLKAKGKVLSAIASLHEEMTAAGYEYLGDYFHSIYGERRIRSRYLSRTEMIEKEFNEICRVQNLDKELTKRLHFCIFRTSPVKSQKWSVGKCIYEKDKARCKSSHPLSEEMNMWATINNIKVCDNITDEEKPAMRKLTDEETEKIIPLFFRKSKPHFDFIEIASVLSGTKAGKDAKGKKNGSWLFNYRMDQSIGGCPVTAAILSALGPDVTPFNWKETLTRRYIRNKTEEETVNDIWHVLEFYDNERMATEWLTKNFSIEPKKASSLASFKLPSDYSALSLKAMKKILPFLQQGMNRYEAVLLANLGECLPEGTEDHMLKDLENAVCNTINEFKELKTWKRVTTLEDEVKSVIRDFMPGTNPEKMYDPNAMEAFVPIYDSNSGLLKLGSPQTNSLRNPLVMRCLVQTRQVVNTLLSERLIDKNTEITFSMNEDINTRNMRKAIHETQKNNRDRRDEIISALEDQHIEVTQESMLRYRLWEEQKHIDILSGKTIGLSDVFNGHCTVEHIIPMSLGGGDSTENRILVFNESHEKHGDKLISEVFDLDKVKRHIAAAGWYETIETYERQIMGQTKSARTATMKDDKDKFIVRRHKTQIELNYWKSKMSRIFTKEAQNDSEMLFAGRYGAFGKYLTLYLKSVFKNVRGIGTGSISEFRKMWGIPNKDNGSFSEFLKDAVTAACIGKKEYDSYCKYRKNLETNRMYGKPFEPVPLPWETFVSDINTQTETVLSSRLDQYHLTKNGNGHFKLRDSSGRLIRDTEGNPIIKKGETARGPLHKETFYGQIQKDGEMRYVLHVPIESITESNLDKVVNDDLRKILRDAMFKHGTIQKALEAEGGIYLYNQKCPVRHVRIYAAVSNPITLKQHRERSRFEYKRNVYVMNEENDCMVIHHDEKGKASFDIYNNLEAIKHFKKNGRRVCHTDPSDRTVRKGTLVIFYENSAEELKTISKTELSRRLFRVDGLGYQMLFRHHLDRNTKAVSNAWQPNGTTLPAIIQVYSKYRFAVEGQDFVISKTGNIIFLF